MKEAKSRAQSKIGDRAPGELRVVGINCNPAPDVQDRLRRLFTLLLELTAGDGQTRASEDTMEDARTAEGVATEDA